MKTNPFILGNLRGIAGSFKQYLLQAKQILAARWLKQPLLTKVFNPAMESFPPPPKS